MAHPARRYALISTTLLLMACGPGGGTYCQTGSRYGTQCYAEPDVRQPPGSHREEEPRHKGEPPNTPPPHKWSW